MPLQIQKSAPLPDAPHEMRQQRAKHDDRDGVTDGDTEVDNETVAVTLVDTEGDVEKVNPSVGETLADADADSDGVSTTLADTDALMVTLGKTVALAVADTDGVRVVVKDGGAMEPINSALASATKVRPESALALTR